MNISGIFALTSYRNSLTNSKLIYSYTIDTCAIILFWLFLMCIRNALLIIAFCCLLRCCLLFAYCCCFSLFFFVVVAAIYCL